MDRIRKTEKFFPIIVKTFMPFLIPLIFYIPDTAISNKAKGIIVVAAIIIDIFLYLFLESKEQKSKAEIFKNRAARIAYSHIYELNEIKRDFYIRHAKDGNTNQVYDVIDYLKDIGHSFRDVIGEITHIEKEGLHATVVYKINGEDEWKWATQKESTLRVDVKTFLNKKETVFNQLMNPDNTGHYIGYIFYNDKSEMEKENKYLMGTRDEMHGKKGSILGIKFGFATNTEYLVEGIIIVSSYGQRFVEDNNAGKIAELKKLIMDVIFPCYQRMLETEMGALYLEKRGQDNIK